jgi:hypothetical protein
MNLSRLSLCVPTLLALASLVGCTAATPDDGLASNSGASTSSEEEEGAISLPRGLFAPDAAECAAARANEPHTAREISKDGRNIVSYASSCHILSSKAEGTILTLEVECSGDGSTWTETLGVVVVDQDTISFVGDNASTRLMRCR